LIPGDQSIAGKDGVECQNADVGAAVDQAGAIRVRAGLSVEAVAQFVQNGGAFAKDGVDLDQLLVGGDQLPDVFPADFKFIQAA